MNDSLKIEELEVINVGEFILFAVFISLGIRIVLSFFRSFEIKSKLLDRKQLGYYFKRSLFGFYKEDPYQPDYLIPFILGVAELLVYPFFIKSGMFEGIAFWLGLKTVAQWQTWRNERPVFNRFLLGTVLILLFSFLCMRHYVV